MEYKVLEFNELIEFLGKRRNEKIDVKVNGKLLTINSYHPPTDNIKAVGMWIKDNFEPLKTCRPEMRSFAIRRLYKEHTGGYCSLSDIKVVMELLGYDKRSKGTEEYYYNCRLIKNDKKGD